MLPLLLLLLPDPSFSPTPIPTPDPAVRLRVVDGPPGSRCGEPRIEQLSGRTDLLQSDLTYQRNDEVRLYLLLDRSIRGCPAPISYALPGQPDGFIRELGRSRPATPVPVHPPRSSE